MTKTERGNDLSLWIGRRERPFTGNAMTNVVESPAAISAFAGINASGS